MSFVLPKVGSRIKKNDYELKFIGLDNHNLTYDNSPTNAGGVAVYVRNDIFDFKVKTDLRLKVDDCESVFLEFDVFTKNANVSRACKSFLLGCVYRHPRRKITEKNKFFRADLQNTSKLH